MTFKLCIFDLDGVVVDTADHHFKAWQKIALELGIPFERKNNEALKGLSRMNSLLEILKLGSVDLGQEELKALCIKKNNYYHEFISDLNQEDILPGCMDLLQQLADAKISVALGSASKNAKLVLEKIGLSGAFACIIDGNDVKNAKPDPEVFLLAAEYFGIEPIEGVVIEDSVKGLVAARNGGFGCVGVGSSNLRDYADIVVRDLTQLSINDLADVLKPQIVSHEL